MDQAAIMMSDAIPPGLISKVDHVVANDEGGTVVEPSNKRHRASRDADTAKEPAPTGDDNDNHQRQFRMLPYYGDHKRAVSSLAFAPTSSLTGSAGAMSYNSNATQVPILCASASADACAKIWDITTQCMNSAVSSSSPSEIGENNDVDSRNCSGALSFNTAGTKLDPKISLIGHSRGINGELQYVFLVPIRYYYYYYYYIISWILSSNIANFLAYFTLQHHSTQTESRCHMVPHSIVHCHGKR